MARIKRRINKEENQMNKIAKCDFFEAGIYRRLSVEQDGDEPNRDSMENQMKIALEFVKAHPEIHVKKVYSDNGISGMQYDNRPAFQDMIKDLYRGVINTVIVKDVSRFGRNFILTSNYVENEFPACGFRLICINDDYDSLDPNADSGALVMQLKMLMNDHYAKDYSRKIRSSINAKMANGTFLPAAGSIPYGYVRNAEQNTYDIDEETAPVVCWIYDMREAGMAFNAIAKTLNDAQIPSPGRIRYERGLTKSEKYADALWLRGAIRKITSDSVYIGNRIHGSMKRERIGMPKEKQDKEKWQIIEHAHKPIITEKQFFRVQEINEGELEKRKQLQKQGDIKDDKRDVLRGKVFCADCGSLMSACKGIARKTKRNPNPTYVFYQCNHYMYSGKIRCTSHYIRQETIMHVVENLLKSQIKIALDEEKFIKELAKMPKHQEREKDKKRTLDMIQDQIDALKLKQDKMYNDFVSGVLEKEEFELLRDHITGELGELTGHYEKEAEKNSEYELLELLEKKAKSIIRQLKEKRTVKEIDRELMDLLVDKIYVSDNHTIKVELAFQDPFKEIHEYANKLEKAIEEVS